MAKRTKMPAQRPNSVPQPWQSWDTTVRYLIIVLGLVLAIALLVWLTGGLH
jgi:hypothetical protein